MTTKSLVISWDSLVDDTNESITHQTILAIGFGPDTSPTNIIIKYWYNTLVVVVVHYFKIDKINKETDIGELDKKD